MKTESAHIGTNAEAQRSQRYAEKGTKKFLCVSPRPLRLRVKSLLASLLLCAFAFMPLGLSAATNDLSGLLQKGLFEEEANRNLEAAAQAYQTVSAQFDKDRKLAATAIFRLGEIYRKQGKTNEAAGQYERIVREFADQDTLVTLSRQNLSALGKSADQKPNRPDTVQRQYLEQQSTVAEMEALVAQLKRLDRQELRRVLPKVSPDPLLSSLLDEMSGAVKSYAAVLKTQGETGPVAKEQGAKLNQLEQQVDERVDEVMAGLERRLTATRSQLDWLKSQAQPGRPGGASEPLSNAVRLEQKRLLQEEISLVEKDLADIKTQAAVGRATQTEVRAKEREVLKLRQQVAALDMDGPEVGTETSAAAPITDDEGKEIRRIQAMIQNSPDLINGPGEGESPLFAAAGAGRLRVATFLLDSGANVNKASSRRTPLHYAVQFGHKAMVELLLQHGADVNAKDGTGGTALHGAAQAGFLSIAEVLLKYKADLNARNSKMNGEVSPLHLAARSGHAALVGFLLASGDDANRRDAAGQTPLHLVAALGRDGVVEKLLKSGADVNATDTAGETPLMEAAQAGHSVSVKALLAAKAKPDLLDNKGRTALSYAAEKGHLDSVQALLEANADPNLGQRDLPLGSAVKAGHLEIVETLLRGGANPNLAAKFSREVRAPGNPGGPDNYGIFGPYLPLQIAVADRNVSMVKLLLKYKADANATDPWGQPPKSLLFYALAPKDVDLMKALLEAGANPSVVDAAGQSPLILAFLSQSREVAALLVAAGADIKFTGRNGETALYLAVACQNKDLTALLLSKGADPNQRMKDGQTPLDLAKAAAANPNAATPKLSEEIAALLRQHGAVDDLPNLDRIEVRRPETRFAMTVFVKGTNDWNQFTLLEAILNAYSGARPIAPAGRPQSLSFPDLHRVVVVRPNPTPGQPSKRRVVDLLSPTGEVDCAKDVTLEFGDVVEIPERDHTLQEFAVGLTENEARQMQECRGGKVGLSVRDKKTELKVLPNPSRALVASVLTQAEARSALFSTSDLSRVKVTRVDAASGKLKEWLLDCSGGNNPDLWLRDGDVIEVPDKP